MCAAMNIAKWLPKQNNDMNKIFTETRNIERELRIMGKQFATNINYKNPDYYVSRARAIFSLRARIKINIPYQSRRLGLPGLIGSRQSSARGKLAHAVQGCARISDFSWPNRKIFLSPSKLFRMGRSTGDKNVERSSFKVLLNKKALQIRKNLKRRHFQLILIVTKLIKLMLCNGVFEAGFMITSLYNAAVTK